MSVTDYLYRPLEGARMIETQLGVFLHRRDPEHEARVLGAIIERRALESERARVRFLPGYSNKSGDNQ